jgi:hypothetical protein
VELSRHVYDLMMTQKVICQIFVDLAARCCIPAVDGCRQGTPLKVAVARCEARWFLQDLKVQPLLSAYHECNRD